MPRISVIQEQEGIAEYLQKRQLLEQYRKAKQNLLAGRLQQAQFKKRKSKSSGIYYFRINSQYRAFGYFEGETFVVFRISDHQ